MKRKDISKLFFLLTKYVGVFTQQLKSSFHRQQMQGKVKQEDELDHPDSYTLKPAYRTRHQIFWVLVVFVIVFFIWTYFATLEEATVAQGRVIPSSKAQVIQNLEGGIIHEVLVREGEHVDKGQLLMRLDDTRYETELNELSLEIASLQLRLARLAAEVDDKPFTVADNANFVTSQDVLDRQRQLYESRQRELKGLEEQEMYAQKELNMSKPLVVKGVVSDVDILHLQQKVAEIQTQISNFKSEMLQTYRQVGLDLSKAQQRKIAIEDRIRRASIRSPINGVVTQIHLGTLGSVIKSGEDIMEIVPEDDALIVEARVFPSDIGFIHPGQSAMVKITAFDFTIYGGLAGKVTHVSADSTENEEGKHYYEVWVKTDKNYLLSHATHKQLKIKPGMMARVDIITGEKSVLNYLLKPVLRAKAGALRER